jgi:hypothetical protein
MAYEFDTTVLSGLPVTVEFETEYEDGECDSPGHYVTELSIIAVNGRTCKTEPNWITKRMTQADDDRLVNECNEHLGDY